MLCMAVVKVGDHCSDALFPFIIKVLFILTGFSIQQNHSVLTGSAAERAWCEVRVQVSRSITRCFSLKFAKPNHYYYCSLFLSY